MTQVKRYIYILERIAEAARIADETRYANEQHQQELHDSIEELRRFEQEATQAA